MKTPIYSLILATTFCIISACDEKANKQIQNHSHATILEAQFVRLQSELQILRKEVADASEPENDPEKLAAMTQEERLTIQDFQINYRVKKQMLAHQAMSIVEEVKIQKDIASEHKESETIKELDILLVKVIEFQHELQPASVQEHDQHFE